MIQIEQNAMARVSPDASSGGKEAIGIKVTRSDFVARLERCLGEDLGRKLLERRLSTTVDGSAFVGAVELQLSSKKWPYTKARAWVGYVFAHDGRRAAFLYGGLTTGESASRPVVLTRLPVERRFGAPEMYRKMEESLARMLFAMEGWRKHVEALKGIWIARNEGDSLLMKAAKGGVIDWGRLGKLDRLRRNAQGETAWELLEWFGDIAGMHPPISSCPVTDQLRRMFYFYKSVTECFK